MQEAEKEEENNMLKVYCYRFFFPVSSSFRNRKSKKREAGRKSEKEETK